MNIHEHPDYSLKRAIVIYTLAVLFLFYEMGLQVSPNVMAYELMRDLKLDAGSLGIMASFYFYSYSLMQIPAGLLFDRIGVRILITLATALCAAGSLFFGYTTTELLASLGRLFMGFGSAFAFTGVLVVAALWFHPHRFAMLVGMAQLFAALGALGGAYPLALLVGKYNWRFVIISLAVIGLVLAIFNWLFIRDHPKKECSPKLFKTPTNIKESMRYVFGNRQNWYSALYAFTSWAPITIFAALWGVPFITTKYHTSNATAASAVSLIWVGIAVTAPLIGWLSDKLEKRTPLMMITSFLGILGSVGIIYLSSLPFWTSYIFMFLMGCASAGQILSFAVIKDNNKPTVIATAIGFNNMAVVLGGAIFQPLVGLILRWLWSGDYMNNVPSYTLYHYSVALIIIPLCYLVCFATSTLLLVETYCKPIYLKKETSQ